MRHSDAEECKLGDIFLPSLWPGPQTVCRAWHVRISNPAMGRRDHPHKICLRHCHATGKWVLIIDGIVRANGFEPLLHRVFQVEFSLEEKNVVLNANGTSGLKFSHTLTMDGHDCKELRLTPVTSMGEIPPTNVTITDTRTFSNGKRNLTMYQMYIECSGGGQVIIERRYSEFVMLDRLIRAQTDSHLLSSLPVLPGKVYNPFFDQYDESFITARRIALETYISRLLGNDKVCYYTEMFCFLGLDPITGEAIEKRSRSLLFSDDGTS